MTAAHSVWHFRPDGSDDRELVLVVPVRTVSETNAREHWTKRHRRRRQQRQTVNLVVSGHVRQLGIAVPCAVTMTRLGPTRGLDFDNLVSSMKATRDGIADALEVDDADPRITWTYEQRRAKTWGIEIRIRRA